MPADIKRRIGNRRAVHSYRNSDDRFTEQGSKWRPPLTEAQQAAVQEVDLNEGFTSRILDVPEPESAELPAFLFAHSTQQRRFHYRHRWRAADLVFWDNRCVIHRAHGCPPQLRRHLHRTTVQGEAPF